MITLFITTEMVGYLLAMIVAIIVLALLCLGIRFLFQRYDKFTNGAPEKNS